MQHICGARFKPRISWTWSRSANTYTVICDTGLLTVSYTAYFYNLIKTKASALLTPDSAMSCTTFQTSVSVSSTWIRSSRCVSFILVVHKVTKINNWPVILGGDSYLKCRRDQERLVGTSELKQWWKIYFKHFSGYQSQILNEWNILKVKLYTMLIRWYCNFED